MNTSTPSRLTVNDLVLQVQLSDQRKTLGLTVDRDGRLHVSAPSNTKPAVLEEFVREKLFWIYTKLAEKDALDQPTREKEFVTGEGFPYLGRSYRLKLVAEQNAPLKLIQGRFRLLRSEAARGRDHFIRWYTDHAQPWLERRLDRWVPRAEVEVLDVRVLDLGFRWGSCNPQGEVNFHWGVIVLPPSITDYVILHELVHLHEPHHTPNFWRRVERAMPDYRERKRWLAMHGGAYLSL